MIPDNQKQNTYIILDAADLSRVDVSLKGEHSQGDDFLQRRDHIDSLQGTRFKGGCVQFGIQVFFHCLGGQQWDAFFFEIPFVVLKYEGDLKNIFFVIDQVFLEVFE